ncbi:MAG: MATE family efflux transporter [Planctomycetaceae bacterium]|nr:MATE family efflux transporter [Planctomycetaceae bacterium]
MTDVPSASTSTFRAMLVLALPVLAEESLNLLVGYTDFFLAGRFLKGDEPLAAMGLVAYFLWVLPVLFQVVSIGALAVVARMVGGGQRHAAAHATRQALFVGILVAAAVVVLVLAGGRTFVAAMSLRGEAARLAVRYIWIIAPAIPLIMVEQVGTACLRGAGDTYSGMLARIILNLVDMTLSAALVTGLGPLPNLGWDGLAIGSAVGHSIGGAIILARLVRGGGGVSIADLAGERTAWWRYDWRMIRRMLRVGIPGGFDVLSVLICHLIYVGIINRLGTSAQAAHGLGVQIEAMSYLPGSAFQVAAATLAGQALGAADDRRAVRGVLLCVASAVAIMTLAGLVMYFAGDALAVLFIGRRTGTAILVGQLLRIVALSCPSLAVLMVLSGALRGSGDTAWPLAITFIGLVGVRIPGACLLAWDEVPLPILGLTIPGLGLGVAGAWWAMVADVALRSLLAAGRFAQGGWQRVKV